MNQDVSLGVTMTITQADIPFLRESLRLGEYAVVYRVYRQQMGGGFGDQEKHPFAWGVLVYVDDQVARVYSARGLPREWTDLTRLEKWMREQGFWYWWMRNDLEPLMAEVGDGDSEDEGIAVNNDAVGYGKASEANDNPTADITPLPNQMFNLVPDSAD